MTDILALATEAHRHAAGLNQPGFFRFFRERRFTNTIDEFTDAVRSLHSADAQAMSAVDLHALGKSIDAIIDDTERFVAARSGSPRHFDRNQHLVTRIYKLRDAFEAVSEGRNPRMMDLRRELESER